MHQACALNASMTVGSIPIESPDAFSVSSKCEPQRTSHRTLWALGFTIARVCSCLLAPHSYRRPPTQLCITSPV